MSLYLTDRELSPSARRVLAGLEKSLPPSEFGPIECWLSAFYDYQLEWILDWNRYSLLNKARQIGASHAYAACAVLWALFGQTTTIVSVGLTEATEVLEKCAIHADLLRRLGSNFAQLTRKNEKLLRFQTNGRIIALPSTSGGRSFSGNVLLDEFAYHDNPETVWDGAAGTIMRGYKLRVMSTPNGVGNMWYTLFSSPEKHKGYTLHEVTLEQALKQGLSGPGVSLEECWKAAHNDPRVFDQLYNCKFLGTELQYIPNEAVRECSTDDLYTFEGDYYAGLDIGKSVDRTVLIVLRKSESGVRTVVRIVTCKRTDGDQLAMMVGDAFKDFGRGNGRLRRLVVDATGIGAFPAERMQKRHGRTRVELINFSNKSKEGLATCLYDAFTEDTIKIPLSDQGKFPHGSAAQLREDVCSIRREITKSNNVRYDAPRSEKGHADSAWALAMAIHASGGHDRRRHEVKLTGGSENIY